MKENDPTINTEALPREVIVYGGAFNPATIAHARAITTLAETFPDVPVWVMPSGERVDKPELLAENHRQTMLGRMATELGWQNQIVISDFELKLPRPSNTFDTVQAMREAGIEKIGFVAGVDSVNTVLEWEYGDKLLHELHWILVERPGYELAVEPTNYEYVCLPSIEVSSTDVRERVIRGEPIGHLVVPSVAEYIAEHKLYKELA